MSKPAVDYGPAQWFEDYSDSLTHVRAGGIAIIGKPGEYAKWAVYLCPCGANGEGQAHGDFPYLINLSSSEERSRWDYSVDHEGRVTLTPSVLDCVHCKSHYFIRDSRVEWC